MIPALDEEHAIAGVLEALGRAALGERGFHVREVVVADNGSSDRTAQVARAGGATVVLEPRRGYGRACLAALAHLQGRRPQIVVFLDADGSDDPGELGALLAPILADRADLVIGSRVLGAREPGSLSHLQVFGNRIACDLMRVGFGGRFTDLGPFRAIRWDALARLGMRDGAYGWTVEMQARALRHGVRSIEVPVRYRRRRGGRSKVSGTLSGVVGAGWTILATIVRIRLGG